MRTPIVLAVLGHAPNLGAQKHEACPSLLTLTPAQLFQGSWVPGEGCKHWCKASPSPLQAARAGGGPFGKAGDNLGTPRGLDGSQSFLKTFHSYIRTS